MEHLYDEIKQKEEMDRKFKIIIFDEILIHWILLEEKFLLKPTRLQIFNEIFSTF